MKEKPLILVMGTPVQPGNRGVMALGASLVELCIDAVPDCEMAFLQVHRPWPSVEIKTSKGGRMVPVITCRMNPRALLRDHFLWVLLLSVVFRLLPFLRERIRCHSPWIAAIDRARLVGDIRGGDSFSDIYGLQRFVIACLVSWSVVLVGGSIVHFPQTYGPFRSRFARWLATRLLRRSSVIYARDRESQQVAQEMVGSRLKVGLSPDVAFALNPIVKEELQTDPDWVFQDPEQVIGLNVNGLVYNGGYARKDDFGLRLDYPRFLTSLVIALLEDPTKTLLLVPHTYATEGDVESDNEASRKVRLSLPEKMRNRVFLVTGNYDQHEIKGVVGRCGFFVGSRMHACIAALSQGVPCVGIAYSRKFEGVFESVGMKEWIIDARSVDNEAALEKSLALYIDRRRVRSELAIEVKGAKKRLTEVFDMVVNTPSRTRSSRTLGQHCGDCDEPNSAHT